MSYPETEKEFSIRATVDQVVVAADLLRPCIPASLEDNARYMIELGFVEALNNIVLHGYRDRPPGDIHIRCTRTGDELTLSISDDGERMPGDLLRRAGGEVFNFDPSDLAGLPEGGMGLSLLRAAFDQVSYQSMDGSNRLELRRRLPPR